MHSSKENRLTVGIIAGNGDLPLRLVKALERDGHGAVLLRLGVDYSVGQAGAIISFFKDKKIHDLVLVGGLARPNFLTLKVDRRGMQIVSKLLRRSLGDDALLRIIREELEADGFRVHGIHEFMPELLCPVGVLVSGKGDDFLDEFLSVGIKAAKEHGALDLGQSVILDARTGSVLAKEEKAGTNALMKSVARCEGLKVLFKASKPQQDYALDLPTIGEKTIEVAYQCGVSGIVVEAGATLIPDLDKVRSLCEAYGIFLYGVECQ
ncbi:MAG: UDP-2,3-diacylglucosamine diphosphatase LpxI [Alphaproteobacteria bacterium]|nr:UDP-2,3-diacylglucosamine diphosphatase LpxI [Alphaproteobacteria bacterium]